MLGRCLWEQRLKREKTREAQQDPDMCASLWGFTPGEYLRTWRAAAGALTVDWVAESPYQCRHAGPSRDRLMHLRSLAEVKKRGRWAADGSVRNYEKAGRVQEVLSKIDNKIVKYGASVRRSWHRCFLDGTQLQAPPVIIASFLASLAELADAPRPRRNSAHKPH